VKLIKLTWMRSGASTTPVYVNAEEIESFYPMTGGVFVHIAGRPPGEAGYLVTESVDEIVRLINEAD
jgi:hypothetical protein